MLKKLVYLNLCMLDMHSLYCLPSTLSNTHIPPLLHAGKFFIHLLSYADLFFKSFSKILYQEHHQCVKGLDPDQD